MAAATGVTTATILAFEENKRATQEITVLMLERAFTKRLIVFIENGISWRWKSKEPPFMTIKSKTR